MKKFFKFFLIFWLYTLYFILYTGSVKAQQLSLSLSPALSELVIKPGQSVGLKFKLINFGDPSIVKMRILPIEAKDNRGGITIKNSLEGPISFELENRDIKLEEAYFLKNSSSLDLVLNISAPEATPSKDYYYSLIAESLAPPIQEGVANVRAKVIVGSNLLLSVSKDGRVEIKPNISLFEVVPKNKISLLGYKINLFNCFEKVPLILVVENKGKNLIKPQGEIVVSGLFGQVKKIEIKPQNILAESQRLLLANTSNLQPQTSNSLLLAGFFMGNYKVSSTVSFGQGTPTLYASSSFLVFPFKLVILLTAVFFLGIFFVSRYKSK